MWKKRKQETKIQSILSEKVGKQLDRVQNKWVGFMKNQESKCSLRQKKIALIVFCVVFAGASTGILINTIRSEQSAVNTPLSIPATTIPTRPYTDEFAPLSRADTINLVKLRKQMDSLSLTAEGREQLERFEKSHPGVLEKLREF